MKKRSIIIFDEEENEPKECARNMLIEKSVGE
jgi:hypothetical protein